MKERVSAVAIDANIQQRASAPAPVFTCKSEEILEGCRVAIGVP